jgi:WD40 repeat protein
LWDLATGKEKHTREASPCALHAVCFQPDGKTVLTVGADSALRAWDAATGRLLGRAPARLKGVEPRFWLGGKFLATLVIQDNDPNRARLTDAATGKLLLEQPGSWLVVSPDGKRIALSIGARRIQILTRETRQVIQTLTVPREEHPAENTRPIPQGFTADGQSLVVRGESVSMWDVATGKQKTSWRLQDNKLLDRPAKPERHSWERIESVALSPDGKTIAFGLLKDRPGRNVVRDWFGRLMVFETATGKLLLQTDIDDEAMEVLAFSPDGKRLAGAGVWTVRLWELGTGKEARQFEGHRGRIKSLAFSPDGKKLASASLDSTVLIWDVAR